jgi:uncharacterized protein (TIGR02569 family)
MTGGQGQTWRSGSLVLKQATLSAEAEWTAELLHRLPESGFRLARPRSTVSGEWVVNGWVAYEWVPGEQRWEEWTTVLPAVRALHAELAEVERPAFLDERNTIWDQGDRAAWSDTLPQVHHAELRDLVHQFASLRKPEHLASQVIHGDVTGNMLRHLDGPPFFIDFAIYWRPAAFAEAIVVADALAWHNAPAELATEVSSEARSLLARACLYRLLTSDAHASRATVDETYLPFQVKSFERVATICAQLPDSK